MSAPPLEVGGSVGKAVACCALAVPRASLYRRMQQPFHVGFGARRREHSLPLFRVPPGNATLSRCLIAC